MKKVKIVNNYGVYEVIKKDSIIIDLLYNKDIEKRKMSYNQLKNINVKNTNWQYLKTYIYNGKEYTIINDYELIKL